MTVVTNFLFRLHGLDRSHAKNPPCSSPIENSSSRSYRSDTHVILACSAASMSQEHRELFNSSRKLCEDQQFFLEHLYPRRLVKSTIRVTMLQGAHILSKYLTDQMKEDIERDELVSKGVMSQREAEKESGEWAEREWKLRFDDFPKKLSVALLKYHAVIIVMRTYEYLAAKFFDQVTLDKLTIDTFKCGQRMAEKDGRKGKELALEMYSVCWRANLISFLADYSVHQIILIYSYYVYVQERRRRRQQKPGVDHEEVPTGALILSMFRKSTLLAMSRGIALGLSSVGGAVGSVISPDWGTLIGTNMGDGLASAVTEELVGSYPVVA